MAILRIVILGCAGTGKTTFAYQMSQELGIRAVIMDELWAGRIRPEVVPAYRQRLQDALPRSSWITDGNYATATFDLRIPTATHIVWLEAPRATCLYRAIVRLFKPGEWHTRRELPMVLKFIWNFDRINRPRILAELDKYTNHPQVMHLGSATERTKYLGTLRHSLTN